MNKPYTLNPIHFAFKRAGAETVYKNLVSPFFKLTKARAFVGTIIASNIGVVSTGVYMNNLFGKILDHLNQHNVEAFKSDIGVFCVTAGLTAAIYGIRAFSNESLQLYWRDWARTKMVNLVCASDRRGGFVQTSSAERSQTGQRITEDVAAMVGTSTFLTIDGARSAADTLAFSFVLCGLSPATWAAIAALSVVGVAATQAWSKKIQRIDDELSRHSNNFRNAIVATAENKQAIEMWRGEDAEIKGLADKQAKLTQSVRERIRIGSLLGFWNSFVSSASRLAPFAIAGSDVLKPNSTTSIGKLTEIAGAAGYMTNSTSWFLNVVPQKNYWIAVNKRLEKFITQTKATIPDTQVPLYTTIEGAEKGVHIKQLSIGVKEETPLCSPFDLTLSPSDRIALTGDSGCGKTTLLRHLAGITPILNGSIVYVGLNGPHEALFVPQDPYIPDLSLGEILSYPKPGIHFTKKEMTKALEAVGLVDSIKDLDNEDKTGSCFAEKMSGGEKQRLNFARLLLHKPKVIGLDEATSSLPKKDGLDLYALLIRELPESIIISTIHRRELIQLHTLEGKIKDKEWQLTRTGGRRDIIPPHNHFSQ